MKAYTHFCAHLERNAVNIYVEEKFFPTNGLEDSAALNS